MEQLGKTIWQTNQMIWNHPSIRQDKFLILIESSHCLTVELHRMKTLKPGTLTPLISGNIKISRDKMISTLQEIPMIKMTFSTLIFIKPMIKGKLRSKRKNLRLQKWTKSQRTDLLHTTCLDISKSKWCPNLCLRSKRINNLKALNQNLEKLKKCMMNLLLCLSEEPSKDLRAW